MELWHKLAKAECISARTPLSLEDARRIVDQFATYYNSERIHSAIAYVTPRDKLEGREQLVWPSAA